MRKAALGLVVAALALASVNATAAPRLAAASCAKSSLNLLHDGTLTVGTDNPAYDPWFSGGSPKGSKWKVNDPSTGKGFESAVAYAVGKQLGFAPAEVQWTYVPFNRRSRRVRVLRLAINQFSYTLRVRRSPGFSTSYYDVSQALVVLKGSKIATVHSVAGLRSFKLGAQLGTTSYSYIVTTSRAAGGVPAERGGGPGAQEQADRRARRRPADRVLRHGGAGAELGILGQFPAPPGASTSGCCSRRGTADRLRRRCTREAEGDGTMNRIQQHG